MDLADISIIYHIGLVLGVIWIFVSLGWSHNILFFLSFFYLYKVSELYTMRLRKRLEHLERKNSNQRRVLSDSESVRWLNYAVEKMWPICMQDIASQLLSPIIPWFLDKYKPWTVSKATVKKLYMGRSPPMLTEMRVLGESSDGDHLVMELGMNFLAADDMSVVLQATLRKSVGFGLTTNMHVTGMHVEGKVLVGVRFIRRWPFLGRVRICFAEPPYFQMSVKPLIKHGMDVTELPGISQWLDSLLDVAFGQTLVEPNMLVIDVEKFVSSPADSEDWFSIDEKPPIAYVLLEILEGADLKPSDLNGLADPYIKGKLGMFKFKTKIQRKTLCPKWMEEFKIPITSWEAPNELHLDIHDKDPIFDDFLGACSINLNELRGGERHEKWIQLKNIKMGRLRLAITVTENEIGKGIRDLPDIEGNSEQPENTSAVENPTETISSRNGNVKVGDEFEPIEIDGQDDAKIWVHRPGLSVSPTFETRKGRVRRADSIVVRRDENTPSVEGTNSQRSDNSAVDDADEGTRQKGSFRIGSMFRRESFKESDPPPLVKSPPPILRSPRLVMEPPTEIDSEENSTVGIDSSSVNKDEVETSGKGKKGFMSMFSRKGSKKLKEEKTQENDDIDELDSDPRVVTSSPIENSSKTDQNADKESGPTNVLDNALC
ncbi:Calcium-dependent lipid-binding (CaLB domain) family protein [Rhynchospora pubera]|uniref:Calcium-dependent lipid-binding (CaLB domain) family protein n=1 Tax=Rhynchospora pubera TaxID=906938 RepID=A0AAV8DBY5_9POAL|nr:Calcium-dependent lipid-binding (CaLB domain) family protein [Rhynchospora pubera]